MCQISASDIILSPSEPYQADGEKCVVQWDQSCLDELADCAGRAGNSHQAINKLDQNFGNCSCSVYRETHSKSSRHNRCLLKYFQYDDPIVDTVKPAGKISKIQFPFYQKCDHAIEIAINSTANLQPVFNCFTKVLTWRQVVWEVNAVQITENPSEVFSLYLI